MSLILKKLLTLTSVALSAMFFIGVQAAAAQSGVVDQSNCPAGSSICNDAGDGNSAGADNGALFGSDGIITNITRLISLATGIVSSFIMIYAGFTFVTSSGDSKKISTARNTILYGAIGLIIALLAQSIVSFIMVNIK